jgi:acyl dehydratase
VTIEYAKLMHMPIPDTARTYTARDTMLYALAIGLGRDPMDRRELSFVLEDRLQAVPTMATVIAWTDGWLYDTGLDMVKLVHGEQRVTLHRPLPVAASVTARTRILDLFDKGPGRGALLVFETTIRDQSTGELLCTNVASSFARGDGGFGGPAGAGPAPHPIPSRPPDARCVLSTRPDQALLYRLCGDRNPLHADPEHAARAGFPRPILHGLCTYGFACQAVLKTLCDGDSTRIGSFDVRFTNPVFPGETLSTDMWRDGPVVSYRTRVVERDAVVLDHGRALLTA